MKALYEARAALEAATAAHLAACEAYERIGAEEQQTWNERLKWKREVERLERDLRDAAELARGGR